MAPTAMLALRFDLDPHTSFWTTTAAAQLFWSIFIGAVLLSIALSLTLGPRWSRSGPRPRKRTPVFALPSPAERRRTMAEMFAPSRPARDEPIVLDVFRNSDPPIRP